MARITVEDCINKVPNRFRLVISAAQRAREIASGFPISVERDNDKNPVIALREIAEGNYTAEELVEKRIVDLMRRGEEKEHEVIENTETLDEEAAYIARGDALAAAGKLAEGDRAARNIGLEDEDELEDGSTKVNELGEVSDDEFSKVGIGSEPLADDAAIPASSEPLIGALEDAMRSAYEQQEEVPGVTKSATEATATETTASAVENVIETTADTANASAMDESLAQAPAFDDSALDAPVISEPMVSESAGESAGESMDESAADKTTAKQTTTSQTKADESVADESVADKSVSDKSANAAPDGEGESAKQ